MNRTKKIVTAAMLAALATVTTIIVRVPSPTGGYIHPGDGVVLLSSLLLGPVWGALSVALGSAFSDFIGGYLVFVPATFIIKGLSSACCYIAYWRLEKFGEKKHNLQILFSGMIGEFVTILGYFLFETILFTSSASPAGIGAGLLVACTSIPANLLQGILGVAVFYATFPVIKIIRKNRFL